MINLATFENSLSLDYGDLLSSSCSCSYSKEEVCLRLGLTLLEKAFIFLWLKIYKNNWVPELDVFGLEVLDIIEVVGGFFGKTLILRWRLVNRWHLFISFFFFISLHVVRIVARMNVRWLLNHLDEVLIIFRLASYFGFDIIFYNLPRLSKSKCFFLFITNWSPKWPFNWLLNKNYH